jgi:two-component system, response regulator YesN
MALTNNLWYLGAQFMASVQARDRAAAQAQLRRILGVISAESAGRFAHYKLRTLQVLTNANRAAFNAGASTDRLAAHSLHIIEMIDRVGTSDALERLAQAAVDETIATVPAGSAYEERTAQEAIAFIRDHFAENVTRTHIAARLGCSPAHFSRVFARTTGYTFKDFLLQCRLEKAKELLRGSHLRVAEVARVVGYDDPFQFSKFFRARTGVSPRQFRDSRQVRVEVVPRDPRPACHERAPTAMSVM